MSMMDSEKRVTELTADISKREKAIKIIDGAFGATIGIMLFIATVICPLMVH